jgi:hypothetical protein
MSPFLHGCSGLLEGRMLRQFAGCVSSIVRPALYSSYGTEDDVQLEQVRQIAFCVVDWLVITSG